MFRNPPLLRNICLRHEGGFLFGTAYQNRKPAPVFLFFYNQAGEVMNPDEAKIVSRHFGDHMLEREIHCVACPWEGRVRDLSVRFNPAGREVEFSCPSSSCKTVIMQDHRPFSSEGSK